MNPRLALSHFAFLGLVLAALATGGRAQIVTGSDGSDGAFVFVQDTGPGALANTMTIDLALAASGLDGQGQPITWQTPSLVAGRGVYDPGLWAVVFKYASVDVPTAKTVRFKNHPACPPVVWLAQGTVAIRGSVRVNSEYVASPAMPLEPGPGGFRGAVGGYSPNESFLASFGPGGGWHPNWSVWGNYAEPALGNEYGSAAVFPLIGGSGASSNEGNSIASFGGSGGGAILIASSTRIEVHPYAQITAYGSWVGTGRDGSGGAIRMVADVFSQASDSLISAVSGNVTGGDGRVRIEANAFEGTLIATPTPSIDLPAPLLPDASAASVRVVSITLGGQAVAVPIDPRAQFSPPQADIRLPASGLATVAIETRNVPLGKVIGLRVAEVRGRVAWYGTTVTGGTTALGTASVQVPLTSGLHAMQVRAVL